MKRIIRDYLTFNKRERNGVFILIAIITLLILYLSISESFLDTKTVDFTKFEKEIEVLQGSVTEEKNSSSFESKTFTKDKSSEQKIEYFNFDPNNLPDTDWKRLGLSDKQIHTIKNYQSKGGKFETKEDVKKMYCISDKMYLSLEPYIQIPSVPPSQPETERSRGEIKKPKSPVELNSADSIQLLSLRGIGAFYAKTIIKYRNSLGGFISKEQLLEVWKFDQEKFEIIKDQVSVNSSEIKKININTCTASELKHPYLKWNMVNAIINYRDKHGKYKTIEEIKKTDLVDDETYFKIAPYLETE